jgi:hypothetical protein
MTVYAALSDEEAYLWAILSDESGLDQAEFAFIDDTTTEAVLDAKGEPVLNDAGEPKQQPGDGCFRAWPFQWPWWRCDDPMQIDRASRSVGKSLSIKFRAFAFPFSNPGAEMVITAPEGVHLDAVTDNVETLYTSCRLAREMISKGRGGIKHRPFMINFNNGARIMGRIPQRDGRGVKGTHPRWLEMDEGSDWPEAAWAEIVPTVKEGDPNARFRIHGVTRGVGGGFDERCQPDSGWKIHALPAMYRPTWNDAERAKNIKAYGGSTDAVDYRRNILGLPGDQNSPIFVLYRLMENVDIDASSHFNLNEYVSIDIDESMVRDAGGLIEQLLDLPASHSSYDRYWIGMDVGLTIAPSSIVIFAEVPQKKGQPTKLKLLAKILLKKVATEDQATAVIHLLDLYRPQAFAIDSTGAGFPIVQNVQHIARKRPDLKHSVPRIKGYNFSSKVIAEFDDNVKIDENNPNGWEEAAIKRNVLEFSTDIMRGLVDEHRLILPYDKAIIGEFQGQSWTYSKSALDSYGRKKLYSSGAFHTLDACRMALLAYQQEAIDTFIKGQADVWKPPPMLFL